MENLTILEKTELRHINPWGIAILFAGVIIALLAMGFIYTRKMFRGAFCLILAICILFAGPTVFFNGKPSGIHTYTVYVGDEATAQMITENYETISRDGCNWKIAEKGYAEKFVFGKIISEQ